MRVEGQSRHPTFDDLNLAGKVALDLRERIRADLVADGDAARDAASERLEEFVRSVRVAVEGELVRKLRRLAAQRFDKRTVASAASAFESRGKSTAPPRLISTR